MLARSTSPKPVDAKTSTLAFMDLGLADRAVIVTGGSRGIGRALSIAFARERARVLLTYNSDEESAEDVVRIIRAAGGDAAAARLDLADPASIPHVANAALSRWGRIDALINNAVKWGAPSSWASSFEELPREVWLDSLIANFAGHYSVIQSVLPSMRERGFGRIVSVSSTIAADGMQGSAIYGAAKAALHGLTRTLSLELGPTGILTNVVMPGLTLTETNLARLPQSVRDEEAERSRIGRLLTPEELAPTVVFLASPANSAVNGELVRASGG